MDNSYYVSSCGVLNLSIVHYITIFAIALLLRNMYVRNKEADPPVF